MRHIVIDIETVPTSGVGTLPEPTPDDPDPFPPLACHRPIVIGYMEFDDCIPVRGGVLPGTEEEKLISLGQLARGAHVVTWNGRGFDLPVIILRCLHHGIQMPWYYGTRDMRYRFSERGHYDLMDSLGDFGAARSLKLNDVARLIGLPGKTGVEGSQVAGLYAAGKLSEIEDYCMSDVAQTSLVWLRMEYMHGDLDLVEYQDRVKLLLDQLARNVRRYGDLMLGIDEKVLFLRREESDGRGQEDEARRDDGAAALDAATEQDAGPGGGGTDGGEDGSEGGSLH